MTRRKFMLCSFWFVKKALNRFLPTHSKFFSIFLYKIGRNSDSQAATSKNTWSHSHKQISNYSNYSTLN